MVIITVDGLAGAGKGTIAKEFAKKTGFYYYDFGLLFRLGTYLYENFEINSLKDLSRKFSKKEIGYVWNGEKVVITIYGTVVNNILISPEISRKTAELSKEENHLRDLISFVKKITEKNKDFICDGRNTGTTIFPEAKFKFYIVASLEIRASRRYDDLLLTDYNVTFEKVLQDIQERDKIDLQREFGPTLIPKDAVVLDTDKLSIARCVKIMENRVKFLKGGNL